MQEKDIAQLLETLDEDTSIALAQQVQPLTQEEHERLFRRIASHTAIDAAECLQVAEAPRISWTRHVAAAASCILVLGGLLGGFLYLERSAPVQPMQPEPTSPLGTASVYKIGERCAVMHLTDSEGIWLTVESAGKAEDAEGLYEVTVTLENTSGEAKVVLTDNLMSATGMTNNSWNTVQPCDILRQEKSSGYPYAVAIADGASCTFTLRYAFAQPPEEWRLVMSYSPKLPSITLR